MYRFSIEYPRGNIEEISGKVDGINYKSLNRLLNKEEKVLEGWQNTNQVLPKRHKNTASSVNVLVKDRKGYFRVAFYSYPSNVWYPEKNERSIVAEDAFEADMWMYIPECKPVNAAIRIDGE